ncbi:MAG: PH domain-containing protein [Candidatus Nanopusillus acidilobi]
MYWIVVGTVNAIQLKIGSNKGKLIQEYLTNDEHILVEGDFVFIKEIVVATVFAIISFMFSVLILLSYKDIATTLLAFLYSEGISLSILIKPYILKKTTKLVITNKRLILAYGTWGNNIVDYSLDKISNIVIRQGLLGRLFGYSEVSIISISGDELDLWQNRELQLKNANDFVKAFVEMRA